mmetsp:Transcript_13225/g.45750  ORF Transcript_13225/g.45750 Transcript_13225/m.45750 type:complete len:253 (+) Transcript_13225:859-1617(+)
MLWMCDSEVKYSRVRTLVLGRLTEAYDVSNWCMGSSSSSSSPGTSASWSPLAGSGSARDLSGEPGGVRAAPFPSCPLNEDERKGDDLTLDDTLVGMFFASLAAFAAASCCCLAYWKSLITFPRSEAQIFEPTLSFAFGLMPYSFGMTMHATCLAALYSEDIPGMPRCALCRASYFAISYMSGILLMSKRCLRLWKNSSWSLFQRLNIRSMVSSFPGMGCIFSSCPFASSTRCFRRSTRLRSWVRRRIRSCSG